MQWFNSFVVRFPWLLPLLMSVSLLLILRSMRLHNERLTSEQIVKKYQKRQQARNKKYITKPVVSDHIPTEEEKEKLRQEYARQRAESLERSKAEFKESAKTELERRAEIESTYKSEPRLKKPEAKRNQKSPDRFQPVRKRDISIAKLRKLTKMVNGQEDVARRLIEGNLKLFPDKSPDWACEKAISDIERDRRI